MALANANVLDKINQSFNTILDGALQSADLPDLAPLRMTVNSNTSIEGYAWLGNFPRIRKWVGERRVSDFQAKSHVIPNETYEGTIAVKREDIEDDNIGLYRPQVEMLGQDVPKRQHRDMVDLLRAAFTGVTHAGDNEEARTAETYDGKTFFSADHAGQSNLFSLGYDLKTKMKDDPEGLIDDVHDQIKKFRRIRDEQEQELLNVSPTTLVYGSDMDRVVNFLFRDDTYIDAGGNERPNPLRNTFSEDDMIELPSLYAGENGIVADSLMMFDTSLPVRPFIWQTRQAPRYGSRTSSSDSDYVFMNNEFLYGLDARWGYGFGLWQLGAAITP